MGIPGLSSFITENSDRYMKPHELKDTYLVIDGTNLGWQFYRMHMKNLSAFGGDYDAIYHELKRFFKNLIKCKVKPIVVFDGAREKRKLKTVKKRYAEKFVLMKNFTKSCWTGVFLPPLTNYLIHHLLNELNIIQVTCSFEADNDIASLARFLNCPVLSLDSDYFIYDVLYIPTETLDIEVCESDSGYYMRCNIYDVTNVLNEFEGLTKAMLPLVAALLGNDFVDSSIFENFFNHVIKPKSAHLSYRKKLIFGIFNWLKSESFESAKELIISYLEKKNLDPALDAIEKSVNNYKCKSPSILPLLKGKNLPEVDAIEESLVMDVPEFFSKFPQKLIDNFYSGNLPTYLLDMANLNLYFLPIIVEDIRKDSAHFASVQIIKAIYIYISNLIGNLVPLRLFLFYKGRFRSYEIIPTKENSFYGVDFRNLTDELVSTRRKILFDVLSFNESDVGVINFFDDNWVLFMISVIYWAKTLNKELTDLHIYVVLLMALCNLAQNRVGYYRNYQTFMRFNAGEMNRLSKVENKISNISGSSFSEVLNGIPLSEFYVFTRHFIKVRQTDSEVTSKGYFISTIHVFASLQSIMLHIGDFNAMLDFAFPLIVSSELYSGTLLYNLYYLTNKQQNPINYMMENLKITPGFLNLFTILIDKLSSYMPGVRIREKPNQLRGKLLRGKHRRTRRS